MGKISTDGKTGLSYKPNNPAAPAETTGVPRCPRCSDRVYFNEERKALGLSFHARCFTCCKCKRALDSTNYNTHDNEVYCNTCHRRDFGPKGYGFAGGASGLSSEAGSGTSSNSTQRATVQKTNAKQAQEQNAQFPQKTGTTSAGATGRKFGGALVQSAEDICPRCGKRVYFAEEVKAFERRYHKLCFKCASCNKLLEPGRCSEHDREAYCSTCYGRLYGPRGYGFAGGAGTGLSSDVGIVPRPADDQKRDASPPEDQPVGRMVEPSRVVSDVASRDEDDQEEEDRSYTRPSGNSMSTRQQQNMAKEYDEEEEEEESPRQSNPPPRMPINPRGWEDAEDEQRDMEEPERGEYRHSNEQREERAEGGSGDEQEEEEEHSEGLAGEADDWRAEQEAMQRRSRAVAAAGGGGEPDEWENDE